MSPQFELSRDARRVHGWLGAKPTGSSMAVIARALDLPWPIVELCLDQLTAADLVHVVRRTKTSEVYGVRS